jgi:hypothetical protein
MESDGKGELKTVDQEGVIHLRQAFAGCFRVMMLSSDYDKRLETLSALETALFTPRTTYLRGVNKR